MSSSKFFRSFPRSFFLLPLASLVTLLQGCQASVLFPSGDIAAQQRDLIIISTGLMLIIIIPVIVLTLVFAWRYRASNTEAHYDPEWHHSTVLELLIWSAPLLIIIALGALTWVSTHKLDPYRPLDRISASQELPTNIKPLTVEVVAMDWKWLFIYPEQKIATVNELVAPVNRPIEFKITSSTMMNSFFIPALAGQIYAMPGMQTKLYAVINHAGAYEGFSSNYSGAGFSDMRFKFYGMATEDFQHWVQQIQHGGETLNRAIYLKLEQPSMREPVRQYAHVAPDLYEAILNRCVEANRMCINTMMTIDAQGGLGIPGAYNITSNQSTRLRTGLAGLPERSYVGAMCTPAPAPTPTLNDPAHITALLNNYAF
jgi:cytochrome o ubiquinol oxidase subunit 2